MYPTCCRHQCYNEFALLFSPRFIVSVFLISVYFLSHPIKYIFSMISEPSPVLPSKAPITASKLPPLRILCLGDSLTEGYSHFGTKFTPYSKWMKEVLLAKWPDRAIDVITDGVSGDLVTPPGGFKRRMERHCRFYLLFVG